MTGGQDGRGEFYGRLVRGAPLAVLLAVGLYGAYRLSPVLQLVAVAMLIAFVLRTAVHGLGKLGIGRRLSVLVVILALAGFGAFVGLVIVPSVVREVQQLYSLLPRYINRLESFSQSVGFIPDLSALTERLTSALSQVAGSLPLLVSSVSAAAGAVVVVFFLTLYMSISPGPLISGALRLVPREKRGRAREILRAIEVKMRGWISGTALVSLLIGVGSGVGLWVLGIPLPVTFGLIAGVLNVVPYLGSTVGALLPSLVALAVGGWFKAILVVTLFVVLNQIEGYVLQPMVMGREVQLHPATTIVSFLVAGALLGVVGALLAVPAAVVFSTLMDELLPEEPSREEQKAEG